MHCGCIVVFHHKPFEHQMKIPKTEQQRVGRQSNASKTIYTGGEIPKTEQQRVGRQSNASKTIYTGGEIFTVSV